MNNGCFFSYRRDDVTFIDSLVKYLQKHRIITWVDFRNLEPGRSWEDQIDKAIINCETFLLVVSSYSLNKDAKQIKREWDLAVNHGKRVILIILEAVSLPMQWSDDLNYSFEHSEWVDFRPSFRQGMAQLIDLLEDGTPAVKSLPPVSGFQMPPTIALFYRLSRWYMGLQSFVLSIAVITSLLLLIYSIYVVATQLTSPTFSLNKAIPEFEFLIPAILVFLPLSLFGFGAGALLQGMFIGIFVGFLARWLTNIILSLMIFTVGNSIASFDVTIMVVNLIIFFSLFVLLAAAQLWVTNKLVKMLKTRVAFLGPLLSDPSFWQIYGYRFSPQAVKERSFNHAQISGVLRKSRYIVVIIVVLHISLLLTESFPDGKTAIPEKFAHWLADPIILAGLPIILFQTLLLFLLNSEAIYRWAREQGVKPKMRLRVSLPTARLFVLVGIAGLVIILIVLLNTNGLELLIDQFITLIFCLICSFVPIATGIYTLWWNRRRPKDFRKITYAIEFDIRDGYIAHKLKKVFSKFGHEHTSIENAELVFIVFSDYHTQVSFDIEGSPHRIIPLYVQTLQNHILERSKIFQLQAVDLRASVLDRLHILARSVHNAEVMMVKLGIIPFRTSFQRPLIVRLLLTLASINTIGAFVATISNILTIPGVLASGWNAGYYFLSITVWALYSYIAFRASLRIWPMLQYRHGSYREITGIITIVFVAMAFIATIIILPSTFSNVNTLEDALTNDILSVELTLGWGIYLILYPLIVFLIYRFIIFPFVSEGIKLWLPNTNKKYAPK